LKTAEYSPAVAVLRSRSSASKEHTLADNSKKLARRMKHARERAPRLGAYLCAFIFAD
jgi:hypothetical protein